MTRSLSAGMVTAAQSADGEVFHLISLEFSGGTSFLTTASHDITWSGDTYTAVGGHLGFEVVQETTDLTGQGVRLTLDGVDQTIISPLLAQNYIGRTAIVYQGHIDSSGDVIVDPATLFSGLLNSRFEVDESRDPESSGTVIVRTTIVSPLVSFRQQRGIRMTLASHQHHYANDTIMRHVSTISSRKVYWGQQDSGGDWSGFGPQQRETEFEDGGEN